MAGRGAVSYVHQECGHGVRNGRAAHGEHPVAGVSDFAGDLKGGWRSRGVGDGDLNEDDVLVVGDVIVTAYLAELVAVFGPSRASGSLAMNRTSCRAQSRMKRSAMASSLTSVTRSSKARVSRDSSETVRMAAMKTAAILTPSGRSTMLAMVV